MLQLITSFPRSGSHLIKQQFTSLTDIPCRINHSPIKSDGAISCIRNPHQSISSILTMELATSSFKLKIPRLYDQNDVIDLFLDTKAKIWVSHYKFFYSFLKKSGHILVDYDKLVENPEQTILSILNIKGIKPLETPKPLDSFKDNLELGYVVKSSTSSIYSNIHDATLDYIDDECMDIFYELLEACKKDFGQNGTV